MLNIFSPYFPTSSSPYILYLFHDPYLNISESGWSGTMPHMSHLARLSLPTIRCPPHLPVISVRNGIPGIPEIGSDPGIGGILNHLAKFATFDLPANFSPKLEI